MLTPRRLGVGLPLVLLVLALVWCGWLVWSVQGELRAAEQAARTARTAATEGDRATAEAQVAVLRGHAAEAAAHTGGMGWRVLTWLPVVGDDARGVRALSTALDRIGTEGAEPLLATLDTVQTLNRGGRIDLAALRSLREPVARAHAALAEADRELDGVDPSGFTGVLKGRYAEFSDIVTELEDGLAAARDATEVLPTALGGKGQRNYLVAFLNNAEIRSSGGMPGSYAHIRAEKGRIELVAQGAPGDLAPRETPVLPLSAEEEELFGIQLGVYFQDANFIQDMPRTAGLMAAWWREHTGEQLDGVLTLDTVGMSYLLPGAGSVTLPDGTALTEQNAVSQLLHTTYLTVPDPDAQNELFASVASATFEAITSGVRDQMALVRGLGRAAGEGRLLVHSFHDHEQQVLAGTRMAGELTSAPATSPEVDLGFDDATASKMSYYLRYAPEVEATSCRGGVQQLRGRMPVSSVVGVEEALRLPPSIVNDGQFGTEPGSQTVLTRIYGPVGGAVDTVVIDGRQIEFDVVRLHGRPVVNLALLLGPGQTNDVVWTMTSGPGQAGPVELGVTPGIEPGDLSRTLPGACDPDH